MISITKTIFRTALIGGLAIGGLTLVVGPERVCAGFDQARMTLVSWVDDNVDDPVLIRRQLQHLQKEYPQKIREIRRSLAEVNSEISSITRQSQIASKAVSLAKVDLASLRDLVDSAQVHLAADDGRAVVVKFQGRLLDVSQAYDHAGRIKQAAMSNHDRLAHYETELELLDAQRGRLTEQLDKLQGEYSTFQSQVWQIERQVARLERNEKLIDMIEERENAITSNDKFQMESLEQLSNRLAAIQSEHEAILQTLTNNVSSKDYETRAREELTIGIDSGDPFEWDIDRIQVSEELLTFPETPIVIDESMVLSEDASGTVALLEIGEGSN